MRARNQGSAVISRTIDFTPAPFTISAALMPGKVHYLGQGGETFKKNGVDFLNGKIREWTTVDAIVSYTFHFAAPVTANQVACYAKDGARRLR